MNRRFERVLAVVGAITTIAGTLFGGYVGYRTLTQPGISVEGMDDVANSVDEQNKIASGIRENTKIIAENAPTWLATKKIVIDHDDPKWVYSGKPKSYFRIELSNPTNHTFQPVWASLVYGDGRTAWKSDLVSVGPGSEIPLTGYLSGGIEPPLHFCLAGHNHSTKQQIFEMQTLNPENYGKTGAAITTVFRDGPSGSVQKQCRNSVGNPIPNWFE